jgi:hypothetical protein
MQSIVLAEPTVIIRLLEELKDIKKKKELLFSV